MGREEKNSTFDFVLKKHGYYKAKYEILYQRSKESDDNEKSKESKNTPSQKPALETNIKLSKDKILKLKKQLLEEEKNLLNIYNIRKG
jgi:hypothetical protein